ncbi:hypothetical protein BKH41_08235 [Helicobacter sp. 12S02232-10]|uniref:YraN family protein n=1 Tax=Helicobacter sp. 12S02232-10 TaxID=1476197 RepID=UPI000BA62C58|nr:YraN family protein [Helicobacter sp. 12S02232-10]PAF47006.1 hypothetical protein BKH41_08235 [Helicobacter sp. 12S02232-10]
MSRKKGFEAEDLACSYLQNNDFEIIKRNFFCKYGEIDIIALKNKTLHFVEVKSGKGFEPIYAITPAKILKITKTIHFFLLQYDPQTQYCIDALIIKDNEISLIENITL